MPDHYMSVCYMSVDFMPVFYMPIHSILVHDMSDPCKRWISLSVGDHFGYAKFVLVRLCAFVRSP